jgi:hypothetical protein
LQETPALSVVLFGPDFLVPSLEHDDIIVVSEMVAAIGSSCNEVIPAVATTAAADAVCGFFDVLPVVIGVGTLESDVVIGNSPAFHIIGNPLGNCGSV